MKKVNKILISLFLLLTIILSVICFLIIRKDNFINYQTYFKNIKKDKSLKKNKKLKKLKILVIQDGAYKKFPEYVKYVKKINKSYCKKYGYEYKFIEHKLDKMPPYWLKVYDIKKYLLSKKYDYVMYLDLDAIFYNFNYSLENVISNIGKKYDIIISKDPYFLKKANTGVFIFKNTNFSRNFINLWKATCLTKNNKKTNRCKPWKYEKEKKWNCKYCSWAGENYEQGVFNNLYENFKDNISIVEPDFFSNRYPKLNSFILHLMASKTNKRNEIFKEIYEKKLYLKDEKTINI